MATVRRIKSPSAQRMTEYRMRLRAQGLRPVQFWLPDTRSPKFIAACREQSLALARSDPAGDELQVFIDQTYEWPET
jgi:Protein  of unknown function (DUF3018)